MSFQTPRSIQEMLTAIHKREYLMPAIQREFVWGADQITKLRPIADSLGAKNTKLPPLNRCDGDGGCVTLTREQIGRLTGRPD